MNLQAGIAVAATLLSAALLGLLQRHRRRSRPGHDSLDLAPALEVVPAGLKHLGVRLTERLPLHPPLPRPGTASRRLGLLLGLR